MNRIATLASQVVSKSPSHSSAASQSAVKDRPDLPHALVGPLHYEKNYAYPLVIWLHGPNGDEGEIRHVIPHISLRNYVSIAPRGTCRMRDGSLGFRWDQSDSSISRAEENVMQCIEQARLSYHVAAHRIFIAGYRCGGTMAMRLALRHPEWFAGALSFDGGFPTGDAPLANLEGARRLPLMIARGSESRSYPVETLCEELRLFHAARMKVTVRLYPGDGELTTKMLQDMDHWIMEQVTGQRTAEEAYDSSLEESN
ncbi:MAG: dienelactone hydrolase family protein [Pirellulaceae bacterium]